MPVGTNRGASLVSLELEGVACGALAYAAGGDASAPVTVEKLGQDPTPRKHLGRAVPEPLRIRFGLPTAPPLADWIAASWARSGNPRRNGAVVVADPDGKERARHEFQNALIVETSLAKLDGASKEAYLLGLTLQPEWTQWAAGSGRPLQPPPKQQKATAADFRLELAGLPTARVASVDPFAVEAPAVEASDGGRATGTWTVAEVSFPDVNVSIAESDLQQWAAWFAPVAAGSAGPGEEREGAIVVLTPDMKTELLRVGLHGVGIRALRHAPLGGASQELRRFSAELYVQEMTFAPGAKRVVPPVRPIVTPVRR
jgi:hypothetical protein